MQLDDFQVTPLPSLERFTSDSDATLRVLIATEEILGPVRNGGIASTYYHLARGLAAQGHEVTVLYLKGEKVENETLEHWVEHYASFGVELIYLPFAEGDFLCASQFWQRRYFGFYEWLLANDNFDVVHTSEWRGGAFYVLMAKQLGLAFADTLFIVKTSSPHIWNRHYQMQPIMKPALVCAAYAEQKCVEWGDMVVGGSAHLVRFMQRLGYRVDEGRTFTQPNVIDFSEVIVEDKRPPRHVGDVVQSREFVFFGRLEMRKGLELFCRALDILTLENNVPEKVTFLGKEGDVLANEDNMKPLEFIRHKAEHWPFPVEIVDDRNQPEALSLLCEKDRFAVMPSLIENSTMAVYEALEHRIPFIATAVGGTPELVDPRDHAHALVPTDAHVLAQRLAESLRDGLQISRPAFDNEENLSTWYRFHRFVGDQIKAIGAARTRELITGLPGLDAQATGKLSVALVLWLPSADVDVSGLLTSIQANTDSPDSVVLCVPHQEELSRIEELVAGQDLPATVKQCVGDSMGEAFNEVLQEVQSDAFVFVAASVTEITPTCIEMIRKGLSAAPDALISSMFAIHDAESSTGDLVVLPMGGDLASEIVSRQAYGAEVIAFTRTTAGKLGEFVPYQVSRGTVHEYVSRAICADIDFLVIPSVLFSVPSETFPYVPDNPNYEYLRAKSLIDESPLYQRKLLLYVLGLQSSMRSNDGPRLNAGYFGEEDVVWLVKGTGESSGKEVILGVHPGHQQLMLAVRASHQGVTLILKEEKLIELEAHQFGNISVYQAHIRDDWLSIGNNVFDFQVDKGDGKTVSRRIRVFKLLGGVSVLSARRELLNPEQFEYRLSKIADSAAVTTGSSDGGLSAQHLQGINLGGGVPILKRLLRFGSRLLNTNKNVAGGEGPGTQESVKVILKNSLRNDLKSLDQPFLLVQTVLDRDLCIFLADEIANNLKGKVDLRIGNRGVMPVSLERVGDSGFHRGSLPLAGVPNGGDTWCEVRCETGKREYVRTFKVNAEFGERRVITKNPVTILTAA